MFSFYYDNRRDFSTVFFITEGDELMINVVVNGALGRMGREVVRTVLNEKDMNLVGVSDRNGSGKSILNNESFKLEYYTDINQVLDKVDADVVVDFTRPEVVMDNLRIILKKKIVAVVGTTGFSENDLKELDILAKANDTGVLIAPNFAMGAILMMKVACEAAKYFPNVEIIELHHDKKIDAPSGTAKLTAEKIAEVRSKEFDKDRVSEIETLEGARGANYEGIHIHSVRLPGFVASQEIIFGSAGETLKIRNDSINRECYMPGVVLGCKKMINVKGLIYGLDKLL